MDVMTLVAVATLLASAHSSGLMHVDEYQAHSGHSSASRARGDDAGVDRAPAVVAVVAEPTPQLATGQRGQPPMSLRQGVLIGAAAGCAFVGVLMARAAPSDTGLAAFFTGCALGAPLGAIAGVFAALGTR